jgi:hypothetical protein
MTLFLFACAITLLTDVDMTKLGMFRIPSITAAIPAFPFFF